MRQDLIDVLKKITPEESIRWAVPLFLILTGVLQYPLSVLGNGFADNQKQLFCFALCHDMLTGGFLVLAFRGLAHHMPRHRGKKDTQERTEYAIMS